MPGVPAIYVDYNQNCTFTMSIDPGTALPPGATGLTVPPGTYQLLTNMPNPSAGFSPCSKPAFTLTGPGVSALVEFAGVELHDERLLTLQPSSTYTAQDENAPAATRRGFSTSASGSSSSLVGSGTSTSSGSGGEVVGDLVGSAILRYRGKLAATVTTRGKVTLRLGGRAVGSLKAGRYDVVVSDEDARAGFSVQHGKHKAVALTTAGFVGKKTKRLALEAGKWAFFSRAGAPVVLTVVA